MSLLDWRFEADIVYSCFPVARTFFTMTMYLVYMH